MTAEPRIEELLASIRKAIHDDIGDVPESISSKSSGTLFKGSMRELHVKVGAEAASAASEIEQLREKISRSRVSEQSLRSVSPRSASLAAALQSDTPRRAWRDLEAEPVLRPTYADTDYTEQPAGSYQPPRSAMPAEPSPSRYHQPQAWQGEPAALPPPRDNYAPQPDPKMMSAEASEAVQSAFNQLAEAVVNRATGERAIEDMTRELLRNMLKQWLDDNLPGLVEKMVREEIEHVARRGR